MTEQDWLQSQDPESMLLHGRGKGSERKFRLIACACVRTMWPLLVREEWRQLVALAEAHADGVESWARLKAAAADVYRPFLRNSEWSTEQRIAAMLVEQVAGINAWASAWNVVSDVRSFRNISYRALADWHLEPQRQAGLLRHLLGNPFHPVPRPRPLAATVCRLAEALYEGVDCAFALHDALLDAGHPELAEHFREEQTHPKGCWVVDMLLGKE